MVSLSLKCTSLSFVIGASFSNFLFIFSSRNKKACIYNIFDDICENLFPGFKKVNMIQPLLLPTLEYISFLHVHLFIMMQATWLECTQEQNEIIFVPSGWYHQVHNLVLHFLYFFYVLVVKLICIFHGFRDHYFMIITCTFSIMIDSLNCPLRSQFPFDYYFSMAV